MLRNSGAGLRTCAAVMSRQRSAVSSQALWKPRSASMGRCASSWTTILGSTTQSSSLRECPRFDRSSASMLHTSSLLRDDVIEVAGPAFADSISEGDIRWLKQKGDHVKEDELVAEIETDKTSVEVPAPQAGVIEELLVADGDKVTAKQKLYKLRPGAGGGASASKEAPKKEEPKKEAPKKEEPKKGDTKRGEEHKEEPQKEEAKKATGAAPPPVPRAETLSGPIPATAPPPSKLPVGPKSSKPVTDIKVSVPKGIPAEQAITGTRSETRVKMNRMRLRIAQRLKDAQNTYAMLTTFNEIDMSNLVDMRTKYQKDFTKKHNIKLGFMSPFIKAAAYALQDQPIVNA
uniref:Dihydrolipoamide acetyltransferase component of pyruvate dehydrogenase complex n=1 Tax=Plectus sambesii TaxID=2011161 RepID=A0A914WQZ8_9BILA